MVSGPLDDAAASETAAALMALDANGDTPIGLHIDSADGTIEAAFVLIDTLDLIRSAVRALCRGQVGGPVIGVVSAADHRAAAPHTRFRLFQPTARFTGTPEEMPPGAASSRTCSGGCMRVWRSARAGLQRTSRRTCDAGVTSRRTRRSITAAERGLCRRRQPLPAAR